MRLILKKKLKDEYIKLTLFKIYGYDCKNDKRKDQGRK